MTDHPEPLPLPGVSAMAAFGLTLTDEIQAGHQSRVFHGNGPDGQIIIKLTDTRTTEAAHQARIELLAMVAEDNPEVVGPIPIGSELVSPIGQWAVVCYPVICGRSSDMADTAEVRRTAGLLARLHRSFSGLPDQRVPVVAALRTVDVNLPGSVQLIHGDFGGANVVATASGLRVIDFDDCGYGTIEFDIGNTLYMAMFDAWLDRSPERFDSFRRSFISGYNDAAAVWLDDGRLDQAIGLRIDALERWLGDLSSAPIGIRKTSLQWRATLGSFITYARGR